MTPTQLTSQLDELLNLPLETEWVEWKHNKDHPEMIGKTLSALANSAALLGKETAYIIWGIEDGTKNVVGTSFKPKQAKQGNEELENWLMRSFRPQISFKIHEWEYQDQPMVLFEVPCAKQYPVKFESEGFIRVGSLNKKLKDYPGKEGELWAVLSQTPFETGIAKSDLGADEVLALLDYSHGFDLLEVPHPTDQQAILDKLAEEKLVLSKPGRQFDITNLGAILFAKDLSQFDRLGRKALRIIKYVGDSKVEREREWRETSSQKGYALAFEAAVDFVNSQLPQNEPVGKAFSREVRMYPEIAIRELVANALIHQDFSLTGVGPIIEIFLHRMEISNPGEALVDTQRFIDASPQSRNEGLAALMRRMKICEEAGSGIDKVIAGAERFQLPAPEFISDLGSMKVIMHAHQELRQMNSQARIRACYQHACLRQVERKSMTNSSLRTRFGIEAQNAASASKIIKETMEVGLIKPSDPNQGRRHASYLPIWA
ncbi:MAG: putative DNA binding domain-containing protein [Planctomycetaceae bacterium]|nr:putative DNA binding domain-containing protein [Planctomycetaceae bacterium]